MSENKRRCNWQKRKTQQADDIILRRTAPVTYAPIRIGINNTAARRNDVETPPLREKLIKERKEQRFVNNLHKAAFISFEFVNGTHFGIFIQLGLRSVLTGFAAAQASALQPDGAKLNGGRGEYVADSSCHCTAVSLGPIAARWARRGMKMCVMFRDKLL